MSSPLRAMAIALVIALGVLAAPTPTAAADLSIADGERHLLALVNRSRAAAGLVAVRVDARLGRIARSRSEDMIARDYYSHDIPGGSDVFALISDAGIRWFAAGEDLGANSFPELTDSAAMVNHQWLESPSHRAVLLGSYNYVGIGLAISSSGRKVWTGLFMRGPDRTRPVATPSKLSRVSSASVRLTWTGTDVRLAVHTAGLRDFQIQRRRDDGPWQWVTTSTTATGRTMSLAAGHTWAFRIRARDRVGNLGAWTTPLRIGT